LIFQLSRFKVNLQVMDDTGSITFIMFDRVVTQFIGRTAQDLLDTMNRVMSHSLSVLLLQGVSIIHICLHFQTF
jgi:CRISPR/Cas system-associated endonuclease Cas1